MTSGGGSHERDALDLVGRKLSHCISQTNPNFQLLQPEVTKCLLNLSQAQVCTTSAVPSRSERNAGATEYRPRPISPITASRSCSPCCLQLRYCARLPHPKASRDSSFSNILLDNEITQTSALSFGVTLRAGKGPLQEDLRWRSGEGRLSPLNPTSRRKNRRGWKVGNGSQHGPVTAQDAI